MGSYSWGVKGLSLDGQFMFERKNTKNRTFANENTFEARDLYNTATTYDANTGALTNNLPWGGILNVTNGNSQNYSIRGQINYDGIIDEIHQITALAGMEIRETRDWANGARYYGYNEKTLISMSGGWVLRPTTSAASPPDCWTATGNWRCTNGTSAPPN